jgi:hypothetical protein
MERTGIAELPLHYGRAPPWLVKAMKGLANKMVTLIVREHGPEELLRRLSDPYWFQAFGCVLGYDWHSSGLTTVVTGVLKSAVDPEEHGLAVVGGKGKRSRRTPEEIEEVGERFRFSDEEIEGLKYASRMSAKVDTAAIQSGYPLYHHAFFLTEDGKWSVVQQGMNVEDRTARRYHWLSEHVESFVEEPEDAIVCDVIKEEALNMVARDSEECRKTSLDLVKEGPRKVRKNFLSLRPRYQRALEEFIPGMKAKELRILTMPRNINWKVLREAYEVQPKDYEELLSIRGIGPATVRGLALVSEMVYGEAPSWKDPVKYSFAYGGKDGVPRPVDRKALKESIDFLENAIDQAKLGKDEKLKALKRLREHAPKTRY